MKLAKFADGHLNVKMIRRLFTSLNQAAWWVSWSLTFLVNIAKVIKLIIIIKAKSYETKTVPTFQSLERASSS